MSTYQLFQPFKAFVYMTVKHDTTAPPLPTVLSAYQNKSIAFLLLHLMQFLNLAETESSIQAHKIIHEKKDIALSLLMVPLIVG